MKTEARTGRSRPLDSAPRAASFTFISCVHRHRAKDFFKPHENEICFVVDRAREEMSPPHHNVYETHTILYRSSVLISIPINPCLISTIYITANNDRNTLGNQNIPK
jgi:hypothetical protein